LAKPAEPTKKLSPREEEVAYKISLGRTTKEIAEAMGISVNTVKMHLTRIRLKLGVSKSTQVAAWAARNLEAWKDVVGTS
jgi:DNA-binding CsgD family transcriptional regulator